MGLEVVIPSAAHLPGYVDALGRGWSADNVRGAVAAQEELAAIAEDPAAFLAGLVNLEGRAEVIKAPDGSLMERLPGYRHWMWDGEFCGSIGFRWRPGTAELPPHVLGHIGYAVVPWKRDRGYASRALALVVADASARGLPYVELTTDPDNIASQRVAQACGAWLVERFFKPAMYGGAEALRWRIDLTDRGVRLYLSSYRWGPAIEDLVAMTGPVARAMVISNALDLVPPAARRTYAATVHDPVADLREQGLDAVDLDLRAYFGDPTALAAALQGVGLIWAVGGNSFLLRRAMRQSGLDGILPACWRRTPWSTVDGAPAPWWPARACAGSS